MTIEVIIGITAGALMLFIFFVMSPQIVGNDPKAAFYLRLIIIFWFIFTMYLGAKATLDGATPLKVINETVTGNTTTYIYGYVTPVNAKNTARAYFNLINGLWKVLAALFIVYMSYLWLVKKGILRIKNGR